ncbi:LacI family DNA-binding transcriptional regulator [Lampropedia aestuarii]|uniref:LacI family DNA-binding transcriptional regulator n=1 Tax=Lampropedia aestuarii TaxID=2562762 RepID=UPI0024684772|nr:LacI family DNA-binding transcriptional regulator [Lampropedia aestuarii]MDH5858701.1 LacI family DNA-binding transcriptional regulator [Lampropedia aestuarii]
MPPGTVASTDASRLKPVESRVRTPRRKQGTHTIHDVAAIAGVSSITVSRYFNAPEKVSASVRERLRQIIVETGYVPNQMAGRLASAESRLVGAVMQNTASLTFAALVKGMSDGFDDEGMQLLLANTDYSDLREERAIRSFIGWHPSALILTRDDHTPDAEALLLAARHPIVETWGVVKDRPFHQVGFPHSEVGTLLTEHFLAQGATRIRFALRQAPQDFRAQQRAEGYVQTMRMAGLQADVDNAQCEDEYEAGAQTIDRFAQEPLAQRPQAIIFASDTMGVGAVLRAPVHGLRFPADVGIAGFGDAPISARLSPALTSVRPKPYEIGLKAAQLIKALKAEKRSVAEPSTQIVPCELIVRESSRLQT